jgi:hypothetical protein
MFNMDHPTMTIIRKERRELQDAVIRSVDLLLKESVSLLALDAHEQTMSHRIAVYLERSFQDPEASVLKIDCEYNKHLEASKRWKVNTGGIDPADLRSCGCAACVKVLTGDMPEEKLFRPDIVVHERNTDENNQLTIEIKKDQVCPFDIAKLKALTAVEEDGGEYHYALGVFLCFPQSRPVYKWFVDGSEVSY